MPALRPRLTMTGALLRGSGELHIVGRREITTIADPDGAVLSVLRLSDGERPRPEIIAELTSMFAPLEEADVEELIAELELAGVLSDAAPRARAFKTRLVRRDAHERTELAEPARAI